MGDNPLAAVAAGCSTIGSASGGRRNTIEWRNVMATPKIKMFFNNEIAKIEAEINSWLAALPTNVVVQRSETVTAVRPVQGQAALLIVVSVWYVEGSK